MEPILDINSKNAEKIIKEAFLQVIGEKYRDVVNKRLNRAIYINYNNFRGIKQYREYLLRTKRDALVCEFLSSIGCDMSKFEGIHEDSAYYEEFERILETYLGSRVGLDITCYNVGIMSFKDENDDPKDFIIAEQISFLNAYLFDGRKIITEHNFEQFKSQETYKRVVALTKSWIPLLEEKKQEFKSYKNTLSSLQKYVEDSEQRLKYIHEQNRLAVYNFIEKSLPQKWRILLDKKYQDKQAASSILGDVDDYFGFAIFDYEYDKILKCGSNRDKRNIMKKRLNHFHNLGYLDTLIPETKEDLEKLYESVMSKEETNYYIPPVSLRKDLRKLKEELINESEKALLIGDYYFYKNMRKNDFSEKTIDDMAQKLYDTPILVSNEKRDDEDYVLLFFTIRAFEGGMLDSILVHEFVHLFLVFIKKLGEISSGFDYLLTDDNKKNPYNNKYRVYERFNETITDIIAQKVLHVLHDIFKVYLLEDESVVRSSINKNTHSILKNLLYPFCHDYLDLIIESFMKEDLNIILDTIGRDNFEKLVDIINYVDNLIAHFKLVDDIENNEDSLIYCFYLSKVEEVIDLYEEMKKHKDNKKRALNN